MAVGHLRLIVGIGVPLALVAATGALRYREPLAARFTDEGRRLRMLRRLNQEEILVRRACGLERIYVDADRWRALGSTDQAHAADAVASLCSREGGSNQLTVIDARTNQTLGRWTGGEFSSGGGR